MRPSNIVSASMVAAGTLWAAAPSQAQQQDASWGCQVLLCAASQNPSWHGVSYCVPPMTKLIAAMAKPGFSWPICHEAKAGKPGREVYEQCPEGTKIGYSDSGGNSTSREPDRCVKTVNICKDRSSRTSYNRENQTTYRTVGNGTNSCIQEISSPRPRRSDPWFFDIPNDQNVKQRHWFNLNY